MDGLLVLVTTLRFTVPAFAADTAATADPFEPVNAGGFFAGPMETFAPTRGGINSPTPIPPSGQ